MQNVLRECPSSEGGGTSLVTERWARGEGGNFHKFIFLLTNSTFCGNGTYQYHILCYQKSFLSNSFWHDRKGGDGLYLDCNGWHLGTSLYTIREIFESDSFQKTPILWMSSSMDDTELRIVTCNQLFLFN